MARFSRSTCHVHGRRSEFRSGSGPGSATMRSGERSRIVRTCRGRTMVCVRAESVQTDERIELVDLTDRVDGVRPRVRHPRGHRQPLVDAHDLRRCSSTSSRRRCSPTSSASSNRWSRATPSGCTTIPITPTAIA